MATVVKHRKGITELLMNIFDFMRMVFGLRVIVKSKNGNFKISIIQRVLALVWCGVFLISLTESNKMNVNLDLDLKNSLIAYLLPTINAGQSACTCVITYILTHAFANFRIDTIEELLKIFPQLDRTNVDQRIKGTSIITATGLLQTLYCIYWYLAMVLVTLKNSSTVLAFIAVTLPRITSACFFIDFVSGVADILHNFTLLNDELRELREESQLSKDYPIDERAFQNRIMGIADRHKALTRIGVRMNQLYTVQLLFNISFAYTFIVMSSYVGLYELIYIFAGDSKYFPFTFVSITIFIFNTLTLVLVVEIAAELAKEVSNNY